MTIHILIAFTITNTKYLALFMDKIIIITPPPASLTIATTTRHTKTVADYARVAIPPAAEK